MGVGFLCDFAQDPVNVSRQPSASAPLPGKIIQECKSRRPEEKKRFRRPCSDRGLATQIFCGVGRRRSESPFGSWCLQDSPSVMQLRHLGSRSISLLGVETRFPADGRLTFFRVSANNLWTPPPLDVLRCRAARTRLVRAIPQEAGGCSGE